MAIENTGDVGRESDYSTEEVKDAQNCGSLDRVHLPDAWLLVCLLDDVDDLRLDSLNVVCLFQTCKMSKKITQTTFLKAKFYSKNA